MHGGGSGRAGIFKTGRGFETQGIGRLQDEGGGKVLRGKARTEMAQHDLVHITGLDPRMVQRIAGHLHDQAFDTHRIELSKRVCAHPTMAAVMVFVSFSLELSHKILKFSADTVHGQGQLNKRGKSTLLKSPIFRGGDNEDLFCNVAGDL